MKKVIGIASWLGGVLLFAFLVGFELKSEHNTSVSDVQIEVLQPANQLFINKSDILKSIQNEDDSILFRSISAINSTLLEESLENHPFIADAEVFSTLDGLLSVRVKQKEAVARVIRDSRQFYLDAEGHPFPTTVAYSAYVPVLTGQTDSAHMAQAFGILQATSQSPYFANWLAEIHCTKKGSFELVPIAGRHRVLFGDTSDVAVKLEKLEAFYSNVVTPDNLNEWKSLNVAYTNQLVSTKYN